MLKRIIVTCYIAQPTLGLILKTIERCVGVSGQHLRTFSMKLEWIPICFFTYTLNRYTKYMYTLMREEIRATGATPHFRPIAASHVLVFFITAGPILALLVRFVSGF